MNHLTHPHRRFCLLPLALCIAFYSHAGTIVSPLNVERVKLFLRGAELSATATAQIPPGESEIVLTQVADAVTPESLNIHIGDSALLLSTTIKTHYLTDNAPAEPVRLLQEKLEQLNAEKRQLHIQLAVHAEQIALLKNNRFTDFKETTAEEANAIFQFIKTTLAQTLEDHAAAELALANLTAQTEKLALQIAQESQPPKPSQQTIVLRVRADNATTLPINVTYVTQAAGWHPRYDVRVKDVDSPLSLIYKADIYQHSGLDWQNVAFTLSSANPSDGLALPSIEPWYLYPAAAPTASLSNSMPFMQEKAVSAYTAAPAVRSKTVSLPDYVQSTLAGINLEYRIDLPLTLKNNSREQQITFKQQDIKASYHYASFPKQDHHAYLVAKIDEWQRLALLPGKAMVFFAGNYIGEDVLTTQGITESLAISLGRDNTIYIDRTQNLNETRKPTFFGNDISQKFAYTLAIDNGKALPIQLTVYDQFPVIQDNVIKLESLSYAGANYDKESGLLTWEIQLKPGEKTRLPFSFTLTYPKAKQGNIIGL